MNKDRFTFRAWYKNPDGKYEMIYDVQASYDNLAGGVGSVYHFNFQDVINDEDAIIEQCTGLKDKNGELIYEGDVLRLKIPDSNTFIVQCVFDMNYGYGINSPGFMLIDIDGSNASHFFNTEWLEVIGNIHEAENIELSYEEIHFCPVKNDCADLDCGRNTPYRRLIELPVWVANIKWNCKKYKKETKK